MAEPYTELRPVAVLALNAGVAGRQRPDAPVAEIAMFIWTICAGIIQTRLRTPSKRGASLAIFNWTRQGGWWSAAVGDHAAVGPSKLICSMRSVEFDDAERPKRGRSRRVLEIHTRTPQFVRPGDQTCRDASCLPIAQTFGGMNV